MAGSPSKSRVEHDHLFASHVRTPRAEPPTIENRGATARLCVLASSSGGNCSALIHDHEGGSRITLLDAGLSPRRTRRHLAALGLTLDQVDDVLITHLDSDHFHLGWVKAMPARVKLRLHARHLSRARAIGVDDARLTPFDQPFRVARHATVHPTLLAHDQWGVAAFRVSFDGPDGATLGFATDVGRVTRDLTTHLAGVDVLAIESNYCPVMQVQSDRPEHLKRRIMGGAGHLSNDQCRVAIDEIGPRRHVVLLHLSRQCNTPERAASHHEGAPYALSIARHDAPIRPIGVSVGPIQGATLSTAG